MEQIKVYINFIKDLISGDEYLSDKDKFTITLHFCAITHLINAGLFLFMGSIVMLIYNLLSFLIFEGMITFAKNKKFGLVTIIGCLEVCTFVVITTLCFGQHLNYNIYCFLIIPAVFYSANIIKNLKRPFLFTSILTMITIFVYAFSEVYVTDSGTALVQKHPYLTIGMIVINILVTILLLAFMSFMFNVEMKNSTEALKSRNKQLKTLSTIDPLTKLANRRSMTEKLNYSMHILKRDKKPFSLILGDIDDFKKVNDTYGHDCGDKVLVMVASTISSQMRDGDFVCRWGGEEILILVNGNIDAAKSLGERILAKIRTNEVHHEGNVVKVTMTFGVAEANESFRIEDFIQKADNRLYYGKTHGKNQVVDNIPNTLS